MKFSPTTIATTTKKARRRTIHRRKGLRTKARRLTTTTLEPIGNEDYYGSEEKESDGHPETEGIEGDIKLAKAKTTTKKEDTSNSLDVPYEIISFNF